MKLLSFMEKRWEFAFANEDMKKEILGISFVEDGRLIPDEIQQITANRDQYLLEEGSIKISEHLKNKKPLMVELYNALYNAVKKLIPDMYEVATNQYIAFRNSLNINFGEIWIQSSQLKIMIREPNNDEFQLGEKVNDSYRWTNNYKIILKKFENVNKIANLILQNYKNL